MQSQVQVFLSNGGVPKNMVRDYLALKHYISKLK